MAIGGIDAKSLPACPVIVEFGIGAAEDATLAMRIERLGRSSSFDGVGGRPRECCARELLLIGLDARGWGFPPVVSDP